MSSEESFARLTDFVEDELSFATSHYNDSYLQRRIASRMRRTGSEDYADYLGLLRSDSEERLALLDALSINVTGFFRNPDVWDGVRDVLRTLADQKDTVFAWSAACADGREPYSLVMLGKDDPRVDASVHVLGSDINDSSLDHARRGRYESSRTIDVGDQLTYLSNYHRFVDQTGDRFQMRDTVRRNVTFEHHDLINDDAKSGFDLVMCRNLFIYIDPGYKQPILSTIAESLRMGGYLVIGKAETLPSDLDAEFEVVDSRLRIYRKVG